MELEEPQSTVDVQTLELLVEEIGRLSRRPPKNMPQVASSFPRLQDECKLHNVDVRDGFRTALASRISEGMHGTYQLTEITSLLDLLHKTAEDLLHKKAANVQRASSGGGQGLDRLPDELLVQIMKLVFHRVTKLKRFAKHMLSLSHIDKRFRKLALGTSDVWTTISTSVSPELTDACLVRSERAGLNIIIEAPKDTCSFGSYMDKILIHASRWKTLNFQWSHKEVENQEIKSRCISLDLPKLERLEYTLQKQMNALTDHIYLSWRLSNLREISFRGVVPRHIPGSSISSVTIRFFGIPDEDFNRSLCEFHSFLQATPTLERLEFKCRVFASRRWTTMNFPRLKMENLRSVDIICGYQVWDALVPSDSPTDEHPLCLLVQSLHSPNLERLGIFVELELEFDSCAHARSEVGVPLDLSSAIFAFTPSAQAHSAVQHLHLEVCGSRRLACCRILLSVPFERFPALRSLSIKIEGVVQLEDPRVSLNSGSSTPGVFPALERISLVKCWGGVKIFLRNLMEKLNGPHCNINLGVCVKHCPFVEERALLEFIAKKDLTFEECVVTDVLQARLEVCEILACPASGSKRSALPKPDFSVGEQVPM